MRLRAIPAVLALALLFTLFALPAWARRGTVTKTDGTRLTGEIVERDAKHVVVLIKGIRIDIPASEVQGIAYIKSPREEYRDRRAKLKDDDYQGRFNLAKWLFYQEKQYELAKDELDDLAKNLSKVDDGELRRDIELLQKAAAAQVLLEKGGKGTRPDTGKTDDKTGGGKADDKTKPDIRKGRPPKGLDQFLLSDEAINIIKVIELRFTTPDGKPVRPTPGVTIPKEVIDKFFKEYHDDPRVPRDDRERREFRGKRGHEQIELFRKLDARKYYPMIKVHTDPLALQTFRSQLHQRWVVNYCGTNECHGNLNKEGKPVGGVFLYNHKPRDPRVVYTNFLVLDSMKNKEGYPIIDRDNPGESLLIQYALPRDKAKYPHPNVDDWKPRLTIPVNDKMSRPHQELLDWIRQELKFPKPLYGISYQQPTRERLEAKKEEKNEAGEKEGNDKKKE